MTKLTDEEKAKVELQVKALVMREDFMAKKAAYAKVQEKLSRLAAEAENRRKGYDRAIARNTTNAGKLKELQMKSYAETVACNVYMRVQKAVLDMFGKDSDEIKSRLEILTGELGYE